jgi:serine/threonine protein kinase
VKAWRPGERVAGYELLEQLGAGGMGVVFRARHLETNALYALKTLLYADEEDTLRLEREGQAMARLEHPHVLSVHSLDRAGGRPFLVAELAVGGDLEGRLAGPMPWRAGAELVAKLAEGVAYAHAAGVLHRDLKPQNVLFDAEGVPKLADFGLARLSGRSRLTETGTVMGTPTYMAPEQAMGSEAGPAADVYSLGAILYRCVSGRVPILPSGGALALLARVQEEVPPLLDSLADVPPALAALCARCLAKEPERRPSAAELAQALGEVDAQPASPRLPLIAVSLLGLVALGLAGAAALRPQSTAPEQAPTSTSTPTPTPTLAQSSPPPPVKKVLFRLDSQKRLGPALKTMLSALSLDPGQLARARRTSEPELYEWIRREEGTAGGPRFDVKGQALPAQVCRVELARLGHVGPYVQLGTDEVSNTWDDRVKLWKSALCFADTTALRHLAPKLIKQRLANSCTYFYLAIVHDLTTKAESVGPWLKKRSDQWKGLKELTPEKAWRSLWPSTKGGTWARARRALSSDPFEAVEVYLDLLEEGPQPEAPFIELMRAAEMAWMPWLVLKGASQGTGLPYPARERPKAELLRQADRVLERVEWAQGYYLRAYLRVAPGSFDQRMTFEPGPRDRVLADLKLALQLQPDCRAARVFEAAVLKESDPATYRKRILWLAYSARKRNWGLFMDQLRAHLEDELDAKRMTEAECLEALGPRMLALKDLATDHFKGAIAQRLVHFLQRLHGKPADAR